MAAEYRACAGGRQAANQLLGRLAGRLREARRLRAALVCAAAVAAFAAAAAYPQGNELRRKGVRVIVPSPGSCVVKGFSAFAPGAVASAEKVRVVRTGPASDEIPSLVQARSSWSDGSVKLAEVIFRFESDRSGPAYFWLEWGSEVRRSEWTGDGPSDSADASWLYFEEAEVPSPDFDLEAGTISVRVEPHPDLWYYLYLVPAGAIVFVLVWRKVKLAA